MARNTPFSAFNFLVTVDGNDFGGFSEVTGLNTEFVVAEYRAGNFAFNHVQKVPGLHKTGDVTFKRGVVNSADMWAWINETRVTGPLAKRPVTVQMLDESGVPVQTWTLGEAFPLKYSGPALNAKGGTDVAMEELVLSAESIDAEMNQ